MAKHTNLSSLFTAIADAIRAKKGLAAGTKIVADNFPDEIAGIETGRGVDLSVITATSSDVLSPKKFVNSNGEPVVGTIATKSNSNLSVSGKTVTGPAGYYPDGISKSISDGALNDVVTISVNSSTGKITASSGVKTAGYLDTSAKTTGEKQLTTYTRTAAYAPTTSEQIAANAGTFLCSAVKIAGDPNLVSSNIKSGVTIFGVTGTFAGSSGGAKRYYSTATADSYSDAFQFSFTTPFSLTSSEKLVHLTIIKEGNAADNEVYLIDYNINSGRLTILAENTEGNLERFLYLSEDGFNEYEAYLTENHNSDGTISITVGICVYESGYTFEDYVSGKNNQDTYIISATFD
jgi:hypothetical protein